MAWGLAQTANGTTGTGTGTFGVAFSTANITAGNRILVAVANWNSLAPQVTSVTDSAGNTYNGPVKRVTESDGTDVTLWDAQITAGGGTKPTVTVHSNQSSNNEFAVIIREYSGLTTATSSYTDGVNGAVGGTGSASSGASSPVATASNELAYGVYGDGGNNDTVTVGSGWSDFTFTGASSTVAECAVEDRNSVSGSGSTATFTLSPTGNPWGAIVAIYQLAAAGGAPTYPPAAPARRRPVLPSRRSRLRPQVLEVQSPPAQARRVRARLVRDFRPTVGAPPWAQAAANTNQPIIVASARPARRWRLRAVRPEGAAPLPSPADGPIPSPRSRRVALPSRRVRAVLFPWFQAAATAAPVFVEIVCRYVGWRRWLPSRRSRPGEPPWGQAAPNTNQPRLVASAPSRRRWPTLRRPRVQGLSAPADAPLPAPRPRRPSPVTRRPRFPQAALAAPTWVPSAIHRRVWPWLRRRLPAWLPLAPSLAPPSGPGTVGAHDRLASSVGAHDGLGPTVGTHDHLAATVGAHDHVAATVGAHDWPKGTVGAHDQEP